MLAERLGMTVERLESEMSVEEFFEWAIFTNLQNEEAEARRKESMKSGKQHL